MCSLWGTNWTFKYYLNEFQDDPTSKSSVSGWLYFKVSSFTMTLLQSFQFHDDPTSKSPVSGWPYFKVSSFRMTLFQSLQVQDDPTSKSPVSGWPYFKVSSFQQNTHAECSLDDELGTNSQLTGQNHHFMFLWDLKIWETMLLWACGQYHTNSV
jgi:hypothetical protein